MNETRFSAFAMELFRMKNMYTMFPCSNRHSAHYYTRMFLYFLRPIHSQLCRSFFPYILYHFELYSFDDCSIHQPKQHVLT